MAIMLALAAAPAPAHSAGTPPVAQTDSGKVAGARDGQVESFKGIPYAAPPVASLRWRAPQPVQPWAGLRAAQAFGPSCMQPLRTPGNGITRATMSEDCLTLNVFRPVGARHLPVMVWIYGGSLITGSSALPIYDGAAFARGGVILVSINYRLGNFGYFVHPALTRENADGGRLGNYGLMDQIAALKWVRRNIAAFGGDPANVTIFGESAGGLSVDGLMISPEARGLFAGAISESGYGRGPFRRISTPAPDGQNSGEDQGTETAGKWGLTQATAAQLRALPADQITPYTRKDNVNFYLDGKTITEDMWASFRAGHEAPVPLLIGSNGLEFPNPARNVAYLDSYMTPDQRDKVIAAYGDTQSGYDHLGSDATFAEQARALARMHVRNGHKAYVYLFNAVAEGSPATAGAGHGSELRYVFDTLGAGAAPVTGAKAQAVATRMNAQWRAFARSRRPDGAGLPAWPAYDGCQILSITLDQMQAVCDPRNARLDVLSQMIDPKS